MRAARRSEPRGDGRKKLQVVRAAARHAFPTADIDQMLAEISRDAIQPAFDAVLGVVDEVFAVTGPDVERAKSIVPGQPQLSARDALHAAVMERGRVIRIMSFDAGFDALPGVIRLGA